MLYRRFTQAGETIDTTLGALEPAVYVPPQDRARVQGRRPADRAVGEAPRATMRRTRAHADGRQSSPAVGLNPPAKDRRCVVHARSAVAFAGWYQPAAGMVPAPRAPQLGRLRCRSPSNQSLLGGRGGEFVGPGLGHAGLPEQRATPRRRRERGPRPAARAPS